jgi:hypothetical protein
MLDRLDPAIGAFRRVDETRVDGIAVEQDSAGTAIAGAAAELRPREREVVPEQLDQQPGIPVLKLARDTVTPEGRRQRPRHLRAHSRARVRPQSG